MDEENKPGALEKTADAIKKAKQMKKTIDLIKKSKVLGPIIGAILPVIGWIFLVLIIVLVIVIVILLAMTHIEQIIDSGDKVINFLSGDGFLTSESAYYQKLKEEYNDFHKYRNREGEFDIALITATTHFNRLINTEDFFSPKETSEQSKEIENNTKLNEAEADFIKEGFFQPVINKLNQVNFYRIATYNVGNIGGEGTSKKLAGHLVDIKLTAGDTCYEIPDNFFDFVGDILSGDFNSEIPSNIEDFGNSIKLAFSGKIDDVNLVKKIAVLVAYIMEGRFNEMVDQELANLENSIDNDNIFADMKRIIMNSDFSNSKCNGNEYFFPKITYYVNYDRYKDYMVDVYLPNQPYAYCDNCDYKKASNEKKQIILENWFQEIMSIRDQYVSLFPSLTEEKNMLAFTCPNGVTVEDEEGNIIVANLDLEEYVKGVVSAENAGAPLESMKAQAVASRTYVLYRTNFCNSNIVSSSNAQNYNQKPEGGYSSVVEEAVEATRGEVLVNSNDQIFNSEYDAFCAFEDCNDLENCEAQYKRVPSSEIHTFSMPSSYIVSSRYKNACSDSIIDDGGHGRGMSQIYANYMANNLTTSIGEKYGYRDILSFFYGEGVKISNVGLFNSGLDNIEETPKEEYFKNTKDDYDRCSSSLFTFIKDNKNTLDSELKNYIGRDYGTRNGPVKAAYFLSGEIRRSGIVLPYFFGGGHGSYPIEGVNKNWGSVCFKMSGNTPNQPYGESFNSGLDCSGFVSWALYNGGFNQNTVVANTLAYLGSGPIAWNEGKNSVQAGDLLVAWYNSSNNYGHVGIVVRVDDTYIWAAHEAGASKGLIIQKFTKDFKTSFSHIVLMDSYYNDSNKRR